jgi:TPR repeat protein
MMAKEYEGRQETENRVKYLTLAGRNPEANQAVDSEGQTPSARALSELIALRLNRKTNKIVNESGWGPLIGINMVDNKVLFEYFPFAKAGDVESQLKIARMLLKGTTSKDSVLWMSKKGYSDGGYAKSDDLEALKYLNPAAAQDNIEAHQCLYAIHKRLHDCPQAFNHLKRAADLGNAEAQFAMGNCFDTGSNLYVKKDSAEALKYFKLAAVQGHPEAQLKVAQINLLNEGK